MAMTQTNIDYLFQVVAPSADRSSGPRAGSGANGFDDHLSQASASVFDVVRTSDISPPRNSSPPPPKNETSRSDSGSHDSQSKRSDTTENRRGESTSSNSPADTSSRYGSTDSDVVEE